MLGGVVLLVQPHPGTLLTLQVPVRLTHPKQVGVGLQGEGRVFVVLLLWLHVVRVGSTPSTAPSPVSPPSPFLPGSVTGKTSGGRILQSHGPDSRTLSPVYRSGGGAAVLSGVVGWGWDQNVTSRARSNSFFSYPCSYRSCSDEKSCFFSLKIPTPLPGSPDSSSLPVETGWGESDCDRDGGPITPSTRGRGTSRGAPTGWNNFSVSKVFS